MRTWVRCKKCETRRTLPRHPSKYLRLPKCKSCGSRGYYAVKNYPRPTCTCSGYPFIHRKGSKHCDFHPEGFLNQVVRSGETDPETLLDVLLDCPGKTVRTDHPPF